MSAFSLASLAASAASSNAAAAEKSPRSVCSNADAASARAGLGRGPPTRRPRVQGRPAHGRGPVPTARRAAGTADPDPGGRARPTQGKGGGGAISAAGEGVFGRVFFSLRVSVRSACLVRIAFVTTPSGPSSSPLLSARSRPKGCSAWAAETVVCLGNAWKRAPALHVDLKISSNPYSSHLSTRPIPV